jgi:pimeloyl-ACP methyl ester carboxylesterase
MPDRRDILAASASALAASLITPSGSGFAQGAIAVPVTKRGFVERGGARIYYEVTGSGPPVIFAHGIGSNHLYWWQQVSHFCDHFTCVTFSHRGYPPSSAIGVPDPREFAGDLAEIIDHLNLPDVRLVAQSMGGWTVMEYILAHTQHKVRALVLASSSGTINKSAVKLADPQRLADYTRKAAEANAAMQRRGVSPPAGDRMAREQPALHMLYRMIANSSAAFDREELRKRTAAMTTRSPDALRDFTMPTLFVTGEEDIAVFPTFITEVLASMMPNARVEQIAKAGHSTNFERADVFNRLVDNFLMKVG